MPGIIGSHGDLKALAIGLLGNIIWFVAGSAFAFLLARAWKLFRPRFWSKMLRSKVVLVVGAHGDFDGYEASGMIGTGDALALAEFVAYFRQQRFADYQVVSARSIGPDLLAHNLILIGGPDANGTSCDFVERIKKTRQIEFGNPARHEIWFELQGRVYEPTSRKDAAAIVYLESPYAEDRYVILVSGCSGHGTFAAAQSLCRRGALARRTRRLKRFEAAVTCEIIKDGPTSIEVQCLV
jgi:hypothetical protein